MKALDRAVNNSPPYACPDLDQGEPDPDEAQRTGYGALPRRERPINSTAIGVIAAGVIGVLCLILLALFAYGMLHS